MLWSADELAKRKKKIKGVEKMEENLYALPKLNFSFDGLEPYISREQIKIHYEKHHQAYVNAANVILERISSARREGKDVDIKSTLKELSFNIGGHILHSIFWENLSTPKKDNKPEGKIGEAIEKEFGSFERFKKEFSSAALSVEGSGWAALTFCKQTNRPLIMQIEKHNVNIYPTFKILLIIDVFEHAYYIDYKNDRAKYIEAFWNLVNWEIVNQRFEKILKEK